jgi:hypothetical protein
VDRDAGRRLASLARGRRRDRRWQRLLIASHGDDLHAIGSTAPLFPGYVGCVVTGPDGTRRMARVMPDPVAQQKPD